MTFRFALLPTLSRVALASALAFNAGTALAADAAADAADGNMSVEEARERGHIVVEGARETHSASATGLPLDILDTPQAVTVVDRDTLDAFAYDQSNDVLRFVTGVNVEAVETDRTYYNARGFDITEAMVDGIALPNIWGPTIGALDTVTWDSIEVVRGANGLLSGTGNPSGTINYIRRHPTGETHASTELTVGSWGKVRGEVDMETALTDDGSWAVRVTGAAQNTGSYLRGYSAESTAIQAIVDGQVTDRLSVSFGYTRQDRTATGVMWGALPLLDSEGNQLSYDVSTSTAQDWTSWETTDQTAYAEAAYEFADGWQVKTHLTRRLHDEPSTLFYVYGTPDADADLGLYGYPGGYLSKSRGWIWDNSVDGSFTLFGREQQLTFGVQRTSGTFDYYSYPVPSDDPSWGAMPSLLAGWDGTEVGLPAFGEETVSAAIRDQQWRVRGATNLELLDGFNVILGANFVDVETTGESFGVSYDRDESAVSPYLGATYTIAPGVNLYASYSDIFFPQTEIDANFEPLGSAKGQSYEAGVKGEVLDGGLFFSAAVYRAEQDNLAEYASYDATTGLSLYEAIAVRSQGVEAEIGGRLTDTLTLQGGVAYLSMRDPDGDAVRTYIPRTTANLTLNWDATDRLDLGAALRWQDDIYVTSAAGTVTQGDYATLNLMAAYQLTDNLGVALNVANVTDHKHLNSLYWDQAFYAAPRSVSASVRWGF